MYSDMTDDFDIDNFMSEDDEKTDESGSDEDSEVESDNKESDQEYEVDEGMSISPSKTDREYNTRFSKANTPPSALEDNQKHSSSRYFVFGTVWQFKKSSQVYDISMLVNRLKLTCKSQKSDARIRTIPVTDNKEG